MDNVKYKTCVFIFCVIIGQHTGYAQDWVRHSTTPSSGSTYNHGSTTPYPHTTKRQTLPSGSTFHVPGQSTTRQSGTTRTNEGSTYAPTRFSTTTRRYGSSENTMPLTTRMPSDLPVRVTFVYSFDYDDIIGGDRAEWETRNRLEIATAAGVFEARIEGFSLTETNNGNIMVDFTIQPRVDSDDIRTETARNNVKRKVENRSLRLKSPSGQTSLRPNQNSFEFSYIVASTTAFPTTRMPSDLPVRVNFEYDFDYDDNVGRDRTGWETRNRLEMATAAGVDVARIDGFSLTETNNGKIMVEFTIQPRADSGDIRTETAKNNVKIKVQNRSLRLKSPSGQTSLRPNQNSFEFSYIVASTTAIPTTRMPSDLPVRVNFEYDFDYDDNVGRDRTGWETRNRLEIAIAAGVDVARIDGFSLTETNSGKIMVEFTIQPRADSGDIHTETAKNNVKRKVQNRNLRLKSPSGQTSLRPDQNSFEFSYIMASTTAIPTTSMPSDLPVRVNFEYNSLYDSYVGRDRTGWETRNRREMATAAGVDEGRIDDFSLTKTNNGRIMAEFIIQPRVDSDDIRTETAKNNVKRKVQNRSLRLLSPSDQSSLRPVQDSFEFVYIMATTTSTTTTTTTTPPPSDEDIYVQFSYVSNYASSVGQNRDAWEIRNRLEMASAAGVIVQRITGFTLTEGSILATFKIEGRTKYDDIPTETAKDNIESKVRSRLLFLRSPPDLPVRTISPDQNSFKWTFKIQQPVFVTFRLTYTYSNSVGRNRTAWQIRNLQEIADAAKVDISRITNFTLMEDHLAPPRINASCQIEPPTDESDIPAEFAKDNLKRSVETRQFKLRAPSGYTPYFVYPYTDSFDWWYIARPTPESAQSKGDDESDGLETYYIIIIAVGAVILLLLVIAIVIIWYKTRKVERKLNDGHYDSAHDSDIFITPSETANSVEEHSKGVHNATYDENFDY